MTKKQLLVVGLIALSLITSGGLYQGIQEEDSDVSLAEEGFMEVNIVSKVETLNPKDQNVLNAISTFKNLNAQKSQLSEQISALSAKMNLLNKDLNVQVEVMQSWLTTKGY